VADARFTLGFGDESPERGDEMIRAALFLRASDPLTRYREYRTLWSVAARNGWSMTVLADDSSGFEELRRLLAQRAVDATLVWHAESLSSLQDELRAAGCGLYAVHQQVEPDAAERPLLAEEEMPQVSCAATETTTSKRIARARGKRLGRPRISGEIEEAIRAKLAQGWGICKTAKRLKVGNSTVAQVRDAACLPVGG
jgi:hypothetical protein